MFADFDNPVCLSIAIILDRIKKFIIEAFLARRIINFISTFFIKRILVTELRFNVKAVATTKRIERIRDTKTFHRTVTLASALRNNGIFKADIGVRIVKIISAESLVQGNRYSTAVSGHAAIAVVGNRTAFAYATVPKNSDGIPLANNLVPQTVGKGFNRAKFSRLTNFSIFPSGPSFPLKITTTESPSQTIL